jgi:hypothetical protein
MKRRLLLVALSLVAVALATWLLWPRDFLPPGYREITVGMTPQQVRAVLQAKPRIRTAIDGGHEWYNVERGTVHVTYAEGRVSHKEFTVSHPPPPTVVDWLLTCIGFSPAASGR